MATMAFLRGWLHCGDDLTPCVRRLIETFDFGPELHSEQIHKLKQCWAYPQPGEYCNDFVFLGATINRVLLEFLEEMIRKLGTDVIEIDGDQEYFITGRFELTIDGESENHLWTLSEGILNTSSRLPRLLS